MEIKTPCPPCLRGKCFSTERSEESAVVCAWTDAQRKQQVTLDAIPPQPSHRPRSTRRAVRAK
jgi:hypothetical protein